MWEGLGREDEEDVKDEDDGEGVDLEHPSSSVLVREEGERVRGVEKRDTLEGGEVDNVGLKTVSLEERVKEGEVFSKVRLKNRAREKSVSLIPWGKGAMGTATFGVRKVGSGGVVGMRR